MHDGDYRAPERITLGDYLLERWLPSKRTRVKPSTANAYERNIKLHIEPYVGRIPLQKLQPEDLDELYVKLLTDGKRNGAGGGLSAKTVRNVHATIQSALTDAARKGTVIRNVADLADPPAISRSGRSMSVWTSEELRLFLDAMAEHELSALYLLAATTGMRRGELAGLPWRNVDLDAARLTVSQQIVSVQYELVEGDLKTDTSRRTIDLDEHTVAQLRRHRRLQLETRLATGRRGEDTYVFAKEDGAPIHPDLITQTSQRTVAHLDVPRIRLHDLRHTHATILLRQGIPVKVVSERLGHSSPSFTMTVYQHVMPGMQAEAAATFGAAVFGALG
ncbi:MAG: site-specific integrase [Actinomycetota bacterium]